MTETRWPIRLQILVIFRNTIYRKSTQPLRYSSTSQTGFGEACGGVPRKGEGVTVSQLRVRRSGRGLCRTHQLSPGWRASWISTGVPQCPLQLGGDEVTGVGGVLTWTCFLSRVTVSLDL